MRYAQQVSHWKFIIDPFFYATPIPNKLMFCGSDGAIIYSSITPTIESLPDWNMPVVSVAALSTETNIPRVIPDHVAIGRIAAEHFLERGFRHFAYWHGKQGHAASLRGKGFRERLTGQNTNFSYSELDGVDILEVKDVRAWEQHLARLEEWLKSLPKPVGILTVNDVCCRHLAMACEGADLRVPEDVALIGVDNEKLICELYDPSMSSVNPNWAEVGYQAAVLLDRIMNGEQPLQSSILIPPLEVVSRQSTNTLVVHDPVVAKAIEFIRNNSAPSVTVGHILGHVGLPLRSLENRFRASIGHGPVSEIRRIRIECAKKLLTDTYLPIAQVAERSGFPNAQSLYIVFRREVGLPPLRYRKQMGEYQKTEDLLI
jgi:LacI family transcriptional regulator